MGDDTSQINTRLSGTLTEPVTALDLDTMVAATQVRANEIEVDRLEVLRAEDAARQRAAAEERNRLIQEQRQRAAEEAARIAAEEAARQAAEQEAQRQEQERLQQLQQQQQPAASAGHCANARADADCAAIGNRAFGSGPAAGQPADCRDRRSISHSSCRRMAGRSGS